jgi:hypothetical protein
MCCTPPFGISDHCSPTPSVVWCHVVVVGGRGTSNLTKLTKKRRYALSMSYLDGTGRRMAGARLGIEMLTLGNRGQVKRRVHACTHARTHVRRAPPPQKTHTTQQHFSHCFLLRQPLFLPLFSPYRDSSGSRGARTWRPVIRSFAEGLTTTGWVPRYIVPISFSILSEHRRLF